MIRTVASTPAKVAKKPPAEKRPQPVKAVEEQEATQILNIENAKGLSKYSQDRLVPAGRVKKGSKVYVEMGGEFLPATVESSDKGQVKLAAPFDQGTVPAHRLRRLQ